MIALGIESTAHTFGIGIMTEEGKILANTKQMFTSTAGGMIPNKVAEHHKQNQQGVLAQALNTAKIKLQDISLISYSHGPGLTPSLKVGLQLAKTLAIQNNIPLVGVNHCIAHLTIGVQQTKLKSQVFHKPVFLYVSGVNTQVLSQEGNHYRIFGETLDIGLGNALDKLGRELKLGFPAGPVIEQLAHDGKYIELPYSVKGMDVSFAGIVTKAVRLAKQGIPVKDLCHSIQETTFAMLAEVSERALAHVNKNALILIGGVAANQRLTNMLATMCKERDAQFAAVPLAYSGDQGVMIAWQGILQKNHAINPEKADIHPYERTDEVKITWE